MAAWIDAIGDGCGPSVLCFSRQAVPLLSGSDRSLAKRGGYTVVDTQDAPRLVLIATGAEVARAVEVSQRLSAAGVSTRVVSMPCMSIFDAQPASYRRGVIPSNTALVVSAPIVYYLI